MKNLKDEIEGKILKQLKAWVGGTEIDPEGLAEVLASLIEQEKERAVKEFLEWYGRTYPDGVWRSDEVVIGEYLAERKG